MTGKYVLAIVEGENVYAMHDKVYSSLATASSALKTLKRNKTLTEHYKVYEVISLMEGVDTNANRRRTN